MVEGVVGDRLHESEIAVGREDVKTGDRKPALDPADAAVQI